MQKHVQAAIAALEDAERGPSDDELHDAPELNPWRIGHHGDDKRMEIHLYGGVRGHPEIDDPYLTTSPVVGMDPKHGWARTRSRWYRLGPDWQCPYPTAEEQAEYLLALQELLVIKRQQLRSAAEICSPSA